MWFFLEFFRGSSCFRVVKLCSVCHVGSDEVWHAGCCHQDSELRENLLCRFTHKQLQSVGQGENGLVDHAAARTHFSNSVEASLKVIKCIAQC